MKTPLLNKRFEQAINNLNEALSALYSITEGITLFKSINTLAVELAQAIESLVEDAEQAKEPELPDLLAASDVLAILDELQDTDLVSDLEGILLDASGNEASPELIQFMMELIEKIEVKFNVLLEQAQVLSALTETDV